MLPMRPSGAVVLIVEDEAIIRMVTADLLSDEGFLVLEAAHADAAIRVLEQRADIRIVFTDISMPGSMDGLKLAMAVRDRWPPMEIIVTSARFDMTEDRLPTRCVFLGKPYEGAAVIAACQSFLALG